MQVSSHSRALTAALHLIAHGTADEKVRFLAERDPDWFVDHVLSIDYTDRDAVEPRSGRIDNQMLDAGIARVALRDRTVEPLPTTAEFTFGALRASA
jgi:hypothetical protein